MSSLSGSADVIASIQTNRASQELARLESERAGGREEENADKLVHEQFTDALLVQVDETRKRALVEEFCDTSSFSSFTTLRREQQEQIPFVIDHRLSDTDCGTKIFELFFSSTVIDRIVHAKNEYAKRVRA